MRANISLLNNSFSTSAKSSIPFTNWIQSNHWQSLAPNIVRKCDTKETEGSLPIITNPASNSFSPTATYCSAHLAIASATAPFCCADLASKMQQKIHLVRLPSTSKHKDIPALSN